MRTNPTNPVVGSMRRSFPTVNRRPLGGNHGFHLHVGAGLPAPRTWSLMLGLAHRYKFSDRQFPSTAPPATSARRRYPHNVEGTINSGIFSLQSNLQSCFGAVRASVAIVHPISRRKRGWRFGQNGIRQGDLRRPRFSLDENLIGSTLPLAPAEFARRDADGLRSVWVARSCTRPAIHSQQLHRLSFPSLGVQPGSAGPESEDVVRGLWIPRANNNHFFRGRSVRGQTHLEAPGARELRSRPNFWLAADTYYRAAGPVSTALPGMIFFQSATRSAATDTKASFGGWLTAQNAATFDGSA